MRNKTFLTNPGRPRWPHAVALALCLSIPLLGTQAAANTVYRWTDAEGNTHFSDSPPPQGRQAETIRMPGRQAARPAPSPRVRQIRCRDFRGALVQLKELDDVTTDDARWLAAKQVARDRIDQWCE